MTTIKHMDTSRDVAVAKLLTGYARVSGKVTDIDSFLLLHGTFEAGFVAHILAWQGNRGLTPDGVIGPETWAAIARNAPICSTSKNRIGGPTLALQLILGGNLTPDAIFGQRTKAAVQVFQDSKGLTADGICGPKTWAALLADTAAQETTAPAAAKSGFRQPVDYNQGDSRWGKNMYSSHGDRGQTMSNSGCGPTAMADIVATLKDGSVTPWTLAQLAMSWGDRTYNSGTAWSFFGHVMREYGFVRMVQSASVDALKACLDAGGYAVCSMGPGYWTKGGHFICAWKYDSTYIYCNDPASSSRKKQAISQFMKERKQFFCFYPDPELPEPEKQDDFDGDACGACIIRGEKICDISHHQPTVDYGEFVADTALIILRTGYRGTGGGVKIDTCFVKHADALRARGARFGTYFYSLADTVEKAREEARMYWKWAKDYSPLFWAMDAEAEAITGGAIRAFADELRRLGAERIGCYVAHELYSKYGFGELRGDFDFVWIPRYSSTQPKYRCDLWQHTSTGKVAGISGNVDLNTITGQGRTLEWFLGGGD